MAAMSLGTGVGVRTWHRTGPRLPASGSAAPVLRTAPRLVGSGRIGTAVTLEPGLWDGDPAPVLALQWLRDGVPLPGATEPVHVPGPVDDRSALVCRVTARNGAGVARADTLPISITYFPPEADNRLADLIFPQNSGVHSVNAFTNFTGSALSFSVIGDGVSIDPATGILSIPTGALTSGLEVTVTAANSGGAASSSFRLTVASVAPEPAAPVLVTAPSLAGSGVIGAPVTVDPGLWNGTPMPDLALQWLRTGAPIPGATDATYVPVAADDRAALSCRVTASNLAGSLAAETTPLNIIHAAPVAAGELADLDLVQGSGVRTVAAAGDFAGAALVFAASGAGAVIDAATGLVSIPTAAALDVATVTVTAINSGGAAESRFAVRVTAPAVTAPAALGTIPDLIFDLGTGLQTVSAQAAFAGEGLVFALAAAPAGVTIDAGSGLVSIATDAPLDAALVAVRAENTGGTATQSFGLTVRATVTVFDAAARLGELVFFHDNAAPAWTYQPEGFGRLVPATVGRVHGDWGKAAGDGLYRCLARWSGSTSPQTVNRPFWFNARARVGSGNSFGIRADLFEGTNGTRQLQLRQYTGTAGATAAITTAAIVAWEWDVWHWFELDLAGTAVRARLYPEGSVAPGWQIAGTTNQTEPGAFGPGGIPAGGRSPIIDLRRLEFVPLRQTPEGLAAPLDSDWDIAQFVERT